MKKISSLLACLALMAQPAQATQLLDRIVTIVDEDVITMLELDQRVNDFRKQLKIQTSSEQEALALYRQVLEKMIRNRIQLQMADRLGIKIDDVALNRTLESLAANNKLTLEELRRTLEADGMKYQRFREQTRKELIINRLQQRMVANKVTVSDQEIDQLIDDSQKKAAANQRYKLRHILISTPSTATPEDVISARERAESVLQRVRSGESFSDLAIQESAGKNALKGGDLGWRLPNELPPNFVEQLKQMKPGATTQPIRSPSGFHLLQLVDTSATDNVVIQTRARHILVREDEENNGRERLSAIRESIIAGEDFAELAREHSDDKGSRENGGELGWADPGTFVPVFESTMQTLKAGEISEPFLSQFGWHIVQVLDRRENTASRDSLANAARQQIKSRKTEEELRLWVQKIRDEAYVEYVDARYSPN